MSGSSLALNPKQAEAVEWCDGPELVLAGAGSGKTRVIAAKIAHLIDKKSVPPYRILALTFTNKAAREMQERVRALVGENLRGMHVSTFHSYGLRFLYRNADLLLKMGYPKSFVVFDRGDVRNLVKRIAKELNLDTDASDLSFLVDKLSRAKTGCDPATLAPDVEERWISLYEKYSAELLRQGALDFDDLMMLPLHILTANRESRERERASIEWILVDEYQDVNTPQ
jgi:DNA helicase-2/ATP-dependent DNA helicase PcrA